MSKIFTDGKKYLCLIIPSKCGSTSVENTLRHPKGTRVADLGGDLTWKEIDSYIKEMKKQSTNKSYKDFYD